MQDEKSRVPRKLRSVMVSCILKLETKSSFISHVVVKLRDMVLSPTML